MLLIYSNSFSAGFTLDNRIILLRDPRIREANWQNLTRIFTQDYWWPMTVGGLYRPVTTLSYLFNYAILHNTDHPAVYHVINLALHWANTLLVYALGVCLFRRSAPALLMAALFACHPIATEAVTNIVGRADLFATASVLGGLLLYIRSTRFTGRQKRPWLLALGLTTLAGVFAKETAVTILAVIGTYDAVTWAERRRGPWKDKLAGYVALLPPLALMGCARWLVYRSLPLAEFPFIDNPLRGAGFWTARLTAIKVIGKYFYLLAWPRTLSSDYSYNQIPVVHWPFHSWEDWKCALALMAVLIALGAAVVCYRRSRIVFFLVLFFFITLLPASNLVILSGSIMGERFLYLPLVGFAGCVAAAAFSAARAFRHPAAPCLFALLLIPYGARTFARNFDWKDDVRLSESALKASPNSFKTHLQVAVAVAESDPHGIRLDAAIREAETALTMLNPLPLADQRSAALSALGNLYRLKGEHSFSAGLGMEDDSVRWYTKSLEVLTHGVRADRAASDVVRRAELRRGRTATDIPPLGNSELYQSLGLAYLRLLKYDKALLAFEYMRKLSPHTPEPYLMLAQLYVATGRLERAAVVLTELLILYNHDQRGLRQLKSVYARMGYSGCAAASRLDDALAWTALADNCIIRNEHVCAAYAELSQVLLDAREPSSARRVRAVGESHFGCRNAAAATRPQASAVGGFPPDLLADGPARSTP